MAAGKSRPLPPEYLPQPSSTCRKLSHEEYCAEQRRQIEEFIARNAARYRLLD